jgi:hypothetical protein
MQENQKATFLRALTALLLLAIPAAAEDLPKELLLVCEGDMNAVMDLPKPESRNARFRISLLLKDGSVSDTATNVIEGAGCVQEKGEIKCELTKQYPFPNAVLKRSSSVVINRNTRGLTLWVESWEYQGQEPAGTPTAHMRVLRTGTCRDNTLF